MYPRDLIETRQPGRVFLPFMQKPEQRMFNFAGKQTLCCFSLWNTKKGTKKMRLAYTIDNSINKYA